MWRYRFYFECRGEGFRLCLVSAGADIHTKNEEEKTALHYAKKNCYRDIIKCLEENS